MESYQLVMFSLLFSFLTGQLLCLYFSEPGIGPCQPINDAHIPEGNQSLWWCKSHFKILFHNASVEVDDSEKIGLFVATYSMGIGLIIMFANILSLRPYGEAFPIWLVCICSFVVWLLGPVVAFGIGTNAYLNKFHVSVVSTCVPVEADVLLLSVWSNSEWNSTDAWLKHANMSSVGAAETIHSWVMGVSISCFVAYTIMIILITIDYDSEGEEEAQEVQEAQPIPIDTDTN